MSRDAIDGNRPRVVSCARSWSAALLVAVVAAVGAFWAGGAPDVTVKPKLPGHRPQHADRRSASRTPAALTKVRVEVVQGRTSMPVAERTFTPRPAWPLLAAAPPEAVTVDVGRETVKGLRAGDGHGAGHRRARRHLAAHARRRWSPRSSCRSAWRRPSLSVVSLHHFATRAARRCVVYRVGEGGGPRRRAVGRLVVPRASPCPAAGKQHALRPLRRPLRPGRRRRGIRLVADRRRRQRGRGRLHRPVHAAAAGHRHDRGHRPVHEQGRAGDPVAVARGGRTRGTCSRTTWRSTASLRQEERRRRSRSWAQSRRERFLWNQPFLPMTEHRDHRRLRRPPDLRLQRQGRRPAGPPRLRHGLGRARRHPGLEQRHGRPGPLLRDLRQRRGDRPRLRPAEPLRPPLVDRA